MCVYYKILTTPLCDPEIVKACLTLPILNKSQRIIFELKFVCYEVSTWKGVLIGFRDNWRPLGESNEV